MVITWCSILGGSNPLLRALVQTPDAVPRTTLIFATLVALSGFTVRLKLRW